MKKIVTIVSVVLLVLLAVACDPEVHTHDFSETVVEVPASCTQVGYKVLKCSCGVQHVEMISKALGHESMEVDTSVYSDYKKEREAMIEKKYSVAVPATCVNFAKYSKICEVCEKAVEVSGSHCDYSVAGGHRYDNDTWTVCDDETILAPRYIAPECGLGCEESEENENHWHRAEKTVDLNSEKHEYLSILGVWALIDDNGNETKGEYLVFTEESVEWSEKTEDIIKAGLTRFVLNTTKGVDGETTTKTLNFYTEESLDYKWTHTEGEGIADNEKYQRDGIVVWDSKKSGTEPENSNEKETYKVTLGNSKEDGSGKETLELTETGNTKKYVRVVDGKEGIGVTGNAVTENMVYFDSKYHYYTRTYKVPEDSGTNKSEAEKTWTVKSNHNSGGTCSVDDWGSTERFLKITFVSKSGDENEKWEHVTYLKANAVTAETVEATVKAEKVKNEIDIMYQELSDISIEGITRTWTYGEWKIEEKDGSETMTFSGDSKVTIVLTEKEN